MEKDNRRPTYYQPGQATDEMAMFPTNRANAAGPDPGLAWCEFVRATDPDGEKAIALFQKLIKKRKLK